MLTSVPRIIQSFLPTAVLVGLVALGFWHAAFPMPRKSDGQRKTIVWLAKISPNQAAQNEMVREFERLHPEIAIRVIRVPEKQYQTKLKTLLAAGMPPDVFETGDVWLAYMMPFLLDLTPFVERDADAMELEDFYPEVRRIMLEGGTCRFVPFLMNLSLLYYNKAIFRDAGLAEPDSSWTWATFLEAGKQLTGRPLDAGRKSWGSTIETGWWGEWLVYVRQAGGDVFNADGSRCLLDKPEAIEGLAFYRDKIRQHGISPAPGKGPAKGFATGAYAMSLGEHVSRWQVFNQIPGLDWDIQVLPSGPANRMGEVALSAYGIAKTTRHPEESWQFLRFLTGPEGAERALSAGGLPVRDSVAKRLALAKAEGRRPANTAAIREQLLAARTIPRLPDFIEVALQIIQPEIDLMVEGRQDAGTAARKATSSANAFLETLATRKNPRTP